MLFRNYTKFNNQKEEITMSEKKGKQLMVEALKEAKEAWEEAKLPIIYDFSTNDAGKIALAMIAIKLFDEKNR